MRKWQIPNSWLLDIIFENNNTKRNELWIPLNLTERHLPNPPLQDIGPRGVHPPWGNDEFPSVSDFPPISENFSDSMENFPNFTFFTFFIVIDSNFLISPYFRCFRIVHPISGKLSFHPPTFSHSLWFRKIYVFFTNYMCFSFPPSFTMMHLCITQCTYWTPLVGPGQMFEMSPFADDCQCCCRYAGRKTSR